MERLLLLFESVRMPVFNVKGTALKTPLASSRVAGGVKALSAA